MEVRVDLRSMGRRAASNDDVGMRDQTTVSLRRNTALSKSSSPHPSAKTSGPSKLRKGFDESGRETEEEEEEDVEEEDDDDEEEEHGGEEEGESGDGAPEDSSAQPRPSDPRLVGLRRSRVSSLPPTQSASTVGGNMAQAAIPRHLLIRQRSGSHPPDRYRTTTTTTATANAKGTATSRGRDHRRPSVDRHSSSQNSDDYDETPFEAGDNSTQSDDYEVGENEDHDHDHDHEDEDDQGEENENENEEEEAEEEGVKGRRAGKGSGIGGSRKPVLSPRRLVMLQGPDALPSLDLDFTLGDPSFSFSSSSSAAVPSSSSSSSFSPSSSSSSSSSTVVPSSSPTRSSSLSPSPSPSPSSSSAFSSSPASHLNGPSPPASPSSSPPQPSYVMPGLFPRTNSLGTMSPRKAKARRLLMSPSLSSSAIMKAPPLSSSDLATAPKNTTSSFSQHAAMASPGRRPISSSLYSSPLASVPALNFDAEAEDARCGKDRRLSTSIQEYDLEVRAAEMGWSSRDELAAAGADQPSTRSRSSLRASGGDESDNVMLGATSTSSSSSSSSSSFSSSSAPFSPKHSRSRSINRLSCSAQLQHHGSAPSVRSSISTSPRPPPSLALSTTSLQPGVSTTSPGHSPRSPLSSPKAIPQTNTGAGNSSSMGGRAHARHGQHTPLSMSPSSPPSPSMMTAPTPATTPSSSSSSTFATRPDAYHSYARSFNPVPSYNSGSEDSEGEPATSSSASASASHGGGGGGDLRRIRGDRSGQRPHRVDSDSGGSGESDYRESESDDTSKGEGSGGETGGGGNGTGDGGGGGAGGGGGGPFLYRADSMTGLAEGFKPRKSLFADHKKRYKSHTLHHHRSSRNQVAANYNSMGGVSVPINRLKQGGTSPLMEEDVQAMQAAKEERRRVKEERRAMRAALEEGISTKATADGGVRKYGSDGEVSSSSSSSSSSASSTAPLSSRSSKTRPISMRVTSSTSSSLASSSVPSTSPFVSPRSKRYSLESPGRISKNALRSDEEERKEAKQRRRAEKEKEKEKEKEDKEKKSRDTTTTSSSSTGGLRSMSRELKQEIEEKGGAATKRSLRSSSGVGKKSKGTATDSAESEGGGVGEGTEEGGGGGGGGGVEKQDNLLRRIQAFRQSKGKSFHTLPSLAEVKSPGRDPASRDGNVIRRKNSKGDTADAGDDVDSNSSEREHHQSLQPETTDEERKRRDKKSSRDGNNGGASSGAQKGEGDVSSSSAGSESKGPDSARKHKGLFHSFVSLPRKAGRKRGKASSKDLTPPSPLSGVTPRSPRTAAIHQLELSSGSHPTIAARRRRRARAKRAADRRRRRSTSALDLEFGMSSSSSYSSPSSLSPPASPRRVPTRTTFPSPVERRRLLRTFSVDERLLRDDHEFDYVFEHLLGGEEDPDVPLDGGEPAGEGHGGDLDGQAGAGGGATVDSVGDRKASGTSKQRTNKVRGRAGPVHSPKLAKKTGKASGKGKQQNVRQKDIDDNRFLTAENFDQLLVNRDLLLTELVKPGLRLVRGLLSVVSAATEDDPDGLCQALVAITDRHGHINQLMKLAIAQELNSTTSPFTLFREDSLGTKFLSTYAREKGGAYLTSVLKPVIKKVVSSHASYEMDPHRIPHDPKASPRHAPPPTQTQTHSDHFSREENQRKLEKLCQNVLDAIFTRQSDFPLQIISSHLYAEVNQKFPFDATRPRAWSQEGDEEVEDGLAFHRSSDWGLAYVGAFIFLRFFCPAIVSPKPHGIVKRSPTRESQRGLMLVAKTLQTMANQLRFGDKEPYMKPMNQFIEDNQLSLENYLRSLTQKPPKLQTQTRFVAPEKEKKTTPSLRDKFSSSANSFSSSSLLTLSSASTSSSFAERSSGALAHSSPADPGDEESGQLAVVQACCTRNQRKLLTFYYSSSLPFLSSLSASHNPPASASSSAGSSPNNSPSSSAPPTPSSSAPPTPSSRSVSPRTGPMASLAPQASATFYSGGSSPRGGE